MPQAIKEEQKVHEQWYKDAREVNSPQELLEFVERLQQDYTHDYGTICHAHAAAMMAAMQCMNAGEQGGITGFQAGAIQWEVIRAIGLTDVEFGCKMLSHADLLYPQYIHKFEQHDLDKRTHELLVARAKEKIAENDTAHPEVLNHWEKIAEGWLPDNIKLTD